MEIKKCIKNRRSSYLIEGRTITNALQVSFIRIVRSKCTV